MRNMEVPVCDLFSEKIVEGQVCYEANINQLREKKNIPPSEWRLAVEKGLILIIDTNDEYDVKNLLQKEVSPGAGNNEIKDRKMKFDPYRKADDEKGFTIMVKSISKLNFDTDTDTNNDTDIKNDTKNDTHIKNDTTMKLTFTHYQCH